MVWTFFLAALAIGFFVLSLVVLFSLTRAASRSDLLVNDLMEKSSPRSASTQPERQTGSYTGGYETAPRWTVEQGKLRVRS